MWIVAIVIIGLAGLLLGAAGVAFALIACGFLYLGYVAANGLLLLKLDKAYKEQRRRHGHKR